MKAVVINLSTPHYNLGAEKLSNWLTAQGYEVVRQGLPSDVTLVCLSAVFSWHVPDAVKFYRLYKNRAEIWAGGPGFFKLQPYWFAQTGLQASIGIDSRFERQAGSYRMVFAARGCPKNCHFCIVTQMEVAEFTMDWDFEPAPILCDNNLSALSAEFQQHIVDRYIAKGVRLLDANSGFAANKFTQETYERWKPIMHGPWRYAFDILPNWRDVKRVSEMLKGESSKKKRVYVLVGNEPIETCYQRAIQAIEWGCEPHCQYVMALDALTKEPSVRFDWTAQLCKDFVRYFNTWGWRSYPLRDYRQRGETPFAEFRYMDFVKKASSGASHSQSGNELSGEGPKALADGQ